MAVLLRKDGTPTVAGRRWLDRAVTNVDGPVYALRPGLPPVIAGAALARLSRYPHDLRRLMLEEFAEGVPLASMPRTGDAVAAAELINRVVTGFGDDSVAQLCNVHLVVEGCSILASKLLEWGRIGAYLERSTRYVYFDQPDENGRYRYHRPIELNTHWSAHYERTLDAVMSIYSSSVRGLTDLLRRDNPLAADASKAERTAWMASTRATACDACRVMLPASVQTTVGLNLTAQAAEGLIVHLFSETTAEAHDLGQSLLREARQVMPAFLKRADLPDRGLATAAFRATQREKLQELAGEASHEGQNPLFGDEDEVTLLRVWGSEADVAVAASFPWFDGGYNELFDRLSGSYLLDQLLEESTARRLNRRHRPPRAYECYHALYQLITDFGIYRDLQRHRLVDGWERQAIDPDLGYDVPELINQYGLGADFNRAFELSRELWALLKQAGYDASIAEYACLLGHRVRYIFAANMRELYHIGELRTQPGCHPNYVRVVREMLRQLEQQASHLTAGMTFVGQGDTEELVRLSTLTGQALAAERLGLKWQNEE